MSDGCHIVFVKRQAETHLEVVLGIVGLWMDRCWYEIVAGAELWCDEIDDTPFVINFNP